MGRDLQLTNLLLAKIAKQISRLEAYQEDLYNDKEKNKELTEEYRLGCINTAFVLREELTEMYNKFVEEHN